MANQRLLKSLPRELLGLFVWLPEVNMDSKSYIHKNLLLSRVTVAIDAERFSS